MVVPTPYSLPSIAAIAPRAGVINALPSENSNLAPRTWMNVCENGNIAIPMALIIPPIVINLGLLYLSASFPHGCCITALLNCPMLRTQPAAVTLNAIPPSAIAVVMNIVRNPIMAPLPRAFTVLKTKVASSILLLSTFLKLGRGLLLFSMFDLASGRKNITRTRLKAVIAHIT